MKRGVIVLNTARGTLIDTAALSHALRTGHVAGAGLDVVEQLSDAEWGAVLPNTVITLDNIRKWLTEHDRP